MTSVRPSRAAEPLLERSGTRELPRLVAPLASHVGRVRACQGLAAEGVEAREAAAKLKLHPFAAEKVFAHAGNYAGTSCARDRPACGARSGAERRQPADRRARARAGARRGDAAAAARSRRPRGEPVGLRLPPGGSVPVQRAARRSAIEPGTSFLCSSATRPCRPLDRGCEAPGQRLRGRAEAEVLEPLLGGGPDALLLLLDVRHLRGCPRSGRQRW